MNGSRVGDADREERRSFAIRCERADGMVRAIVVGELDLQTEPKLVESVDAALRQGGITKVVLDLTDVAFIDSSGLRGVLVCRRRAEDAGATLSLAVRPGNVTRLFDVAGVTSWFHYD